MARRTISYMPLDALESAPTNPKQHATELIGRSIDRFGLVEVITLDERTGKIISGHGRRDDLLAKKANGAEPPADVQVKAGEWLVPVSRGWSSADDAEALAAGIALNQVGPAGGWILEDLAPALEELGALEFGLDGLGFAPADIDSILASLELARTPEEEKPPVMPGVPTDPVTKPGDVWVLGEHRLICGDCRDPEVVATVLDGATINVAFTSPPYAEQRDYDEASGFVPIPPDEYVEWFAAVSANVAAHLAGDGSWFVNIKPPGIDLDTHLYVLDLVAAHAREWGWHFATEFCWQRVGVPKKVTRRFKNQFEPIYQFTRGEWKVRPENVRSASESSIAPLGVGGSIGRDASLAGNQGGTGNGLLPQGNSGTMSRVQGVRGGPNVGKHPRRKPQTASNADSQGTDWDAGGMIGVGFAYPGNRLPTFTGSHEATGHSAAFPVGLPAWFARAFSDEGDTLYDPFCGSGSSLLAAQETGRRGFGVELSPGYCDVALRRFQAHTGIQPRKVGSKKAADFSA